jgi:prepilin-type processing-associated H-X9-DG protein
MRDTRNGYGTGYAYHLSFGSAHVAGWNVVFCDGSVRMMTYNLDPETHRRLSNRKDGLVIDQSKFDE